MFWKRAAARIPSFSSQIRSDASFAYLNKTRHKPAKCHYWSQKNLAVLDRDAHTSNPCILEDEVGEQGGRCSVADYIMAHRTKKK